MKNVMIQLICWLSLVSPVHADDRFQWEELELLPNTVGVAGPFVGVYNDVLIVAGGANFPDKRPWDGGVKVWWDDIHVMERGSDGMPEWIRDADFKLPKPLAYGVAISIPQGILLIGGCDAERCYDDVMLLQWDSDAKQIHL